ncbi:MAG: DNA-processing protein DprA [Gammaproteobacteria bacterium]|nr:DNA-processing protein DprA [Gammaproteobacteria bacterium]
MTDTDLKRWLVLLRVPGLGSVGIRELLEHAGNLERLFCAPPADLNPALTAVLRRPDWATAEADLAWADGDQRHILPLDDPRYPPLLGALPDAPPVLFVLGDPTALSAPQLAMVGSRNPTPTGAETAYAFARHLAGAGLVITSGLALGVDAASHKGALDAPGQTIAVAGTGLDRVYPARHKGLAHAIAAEGALVSEFPPGTPPLPHHFPRRNRIISGLSAGTLVVEAALGSGSLITARTAVEQGREVFAIPGSIHNPLARGCHRLIREGAKLVETAADVLEELAPQLRAALAQPEAADRTPAVELDPAACRLLESLDQAPTSVDLLVERSGLTAETVSSMLLVLELQGYVAAVNGGHYIRTGKRV